MRKIFLIFLLFFGGFLPVFADQCKYQAKIDTCNAQLASFLKRPPEDVMINAWSLKDFTEFPCLQASLETRVFQIIIDEKFSEIDKIMDEYLKNLSENKSYFFWKDKKSSYFDWIVDIYTKSDFLRKKYKKACEEATFEVAECLWSVIATSSVNYISGWWHKQTCQLFFEAKLKVFSELSYNLLLLNKEQVSKDEYKLYTQNQRTLYGALSDAVMINEAFVWRLSKKWTVKVKHTY